MSQLRTHELCDLTIASNRYGDDIPDSPGQEVCHISYRSTSYGVIIACDEKQTTVLWSIPPPVRYNPISYDETPWVPIRNSNPSSVCDPECQCRKHASIQQEKEDISWFERQLRRMLKKK